MKIYISGKITDLPPAEAKANFELAEQEIRAKYGEDVQISNPIRFSPYVEGKTWKAYMADCVAELETCSHIYMLNNWADSKGAKVEYALAKMNEMTIEFRK